MAGEACMTSVLEDANMETCHDDHCGIVISMNYRMIGRDRRTR